MPYSSFNVTSFEILQPNKDDAVNLNFLHMFKNSVSTAQSKTKANKAR